MFQKFVHPLNYQCIPKNTSSVYSGVEIIQLKNSAIEYTWTSVVELKKVFKKITKRSLASVIEDVWVVGGGGGGHRVRQDPADQQVRQRSL